MSCKSVFYLYKENLSLHCESLHPITCSLKSKKVNTITDIKLQSDVLSPKGKKESLTS